MLLWLGLCTLQSTLSASPYNGPSPHSRINPAALWFTCDTCRCHPCNALPHPSRVFPRFRQRNIQRLESFPSCLLPAVSDLRVREQQLKESQDCGVKISPSWGCPSCIWKDFPLPERKSEHIENFQKQEVVTLIMSSAADVPLRPDARS